MASKIGILKTTRSDIWIKHLHFEKLIGKRGRNPANHPTFLSNRAQFIKSFNDRINLQDVRDVYLPLTNLIGIYKRSKEDLAFSKVFFKKRVNANLYHWGFRER